MVLKGMSAIDESLCLRDVYLSGYSFFSLLNSSSMVSKGLSLMSSMFSQPMTCKERCRANSITHCRQGYFKVNIVCKQSMRQVTSSTRNLK